MDLPTNSASEPWEQCYQTGDTPWDRGQPAPVLAQLLSRSTSLFQERRVVTPGCGTGQDARLLAAHGARVTAIDIAPSALERARALDPGSLVDWRQEDLFSLAGELLGAFDVIWEHTCLSALPPEKRETYAAAYRSMLKPEGSLHGVFYIDPDLDPGETGPPFPISVEEVLSLWERQGFEIVEHWVPEVAYEGREGRERYVWAKLKA